MQKILFTVLSLPILFGTCHSQPKASYFEPVAVVELFTSEGCSSCPPADRILSRLTAETQRDHRRIYTLSFHVDYWDRLGWRDPYSSSANSDRQRQYAELMKLQSVYTPQMIVNGRIEFVGSDQSKLNDAIKKALSLNSTASFSKLNVTAKEGQKIAVNYEAKGDIKGCEIHFALVSKHESTAVKRGENGGHQLDHTNVVRQFLTIPAAAQGEATFDLSPVPDGNNWLVIAYIQHTDDLRIIAAAEANP